eukprot:3097708-Amphidinium_carterae.1
MRLTKYHVKHIVRMNCHTAKNLVLRGYTRAPFNPSPVEFRVQVGSGFGMALSGRIVTQL